jgi:23S rRNA (pseudouridine1915-N3)-methyltransferase
MCMTVAILRGIATYWFYIESKRLNCPCNELGFSMAWLWIWKSGDLGDHIPKSGSVSRFWGVSSISCIAHHMQLEYPRPMQLTLAHIGPRVTQGSRSKDSFAQLADLYLGRCAPFARCGAEAFRSEESLLEWIEKLQGRTTPAAILLDSRGRNMSSEAFAVWLGKQRDDGAQHLIFAIGPADGWSSVARERAQLLLSLGPMTMAHSLARLVMAEQLYRAFTILSGHPYHRA